MIKFENLATKLRNRFVLAAIVIILAGITVYVFKANWGVDYADADIYILQSDNTGLPEGVTTDAQKLAQISRIEKVNDQNLYLYFQNSTDNTSADMFQFAENHNLTITGNYLYKFSQEEFRLLPNRIVTYAMFLLVVGFIYYGVDLRGLDWKRWQVGYYIFNEMLITAAVAIVLLGLASLLGQTGIKMDNDFTGFMAIALSIGVIYRLYELEVIKRVALNNAKKVNYAELKNVFKSRRPELILLSCVLLLVGFMPFIVILGKFSVMALLILSAIITNYLFAEFIKPYLLAFILELGEKSKFIQKSIFQKQW